MDNLSIDELLAILASASGDEVIDLVHRFQRGALCIDGKSAADFEEN